MRREFFCSDHCGNIIGFDHSVRNEPDKADLQINGNPLGQEWCEAGLSYSSCYDWGYVDGINSSPLRPTTGHFWIEDAIQVDGSPANLQYVDFVKVHTAINAMTKNVGEISTEPKMPYDLN
ncbi:MAG: hypothetical protein LBL24_08750, partial [Bacteroidales bacterium]|nr:hypothetical protein [Bacteroidales bacterium]